jgi:hypothetical protein
MISSSSPNLQGFATDTWVNASWEEFMVLADNSTYYQKLRVSNYSPQLSRIRGVGKASFTKHYQIGKKFYKRQYAIALELLKMALD